MLNVPNRWTRTRCGQKVEKCGQVCTVREVAVAEKAVLSTAEPPREEQMPSKIKEVLEEWGGDWMWKSLRILGNDGWITKAIEGGTLVVVTNGSYMREMYPEICSAAFILECSKGGGRMISSFPEQSITANAYRAELMGLLAISTYNPQGYQCNLA